MTQTYNANQARRCTLQIGDKAERLHPTRNGPQERHISESERDCATTSRPSSDFVPDEALNKLNIKATQRRAQGEPNDEGQLNDAIETRYEFRLHSDVKCSTQRDDDAQSS